MAAAMRFVAVVALLATIGAAVAHRIHLRDAPAEVPNGWSLIERANPAAKLRVSFFLTQSNLDKVDDIFRRVTDPDSTEWRNYLSAAEIRDIVRPSDKHVAAVSDWLAAAGIAADIPATGDVVYATMTVVQAETLLESAPFHVYASEQAKRRAVLTLGPYSLPAEVAEAVSVIGGVSRFPATFSPKRVSSAVDADYSEDTFGLLSQTAGDAQLLVIFRPGCADGSVPTTETNMCANTSAITSFSVKVSGESFDSITKTYSASVVDGTGDGLLTCHTCANWVPTLYASITEGLCANQSRWDAVGVVCVVTVRPLENYVPLHISSFTTLYANGSSVVSGGLYNAILSPFTTPDLIQQLYGVPRGTRGASPQNSQAAEEFLSQYYTPADLDNFFQVHGVTAQPQPIVIGPNDASNPGGEATLDIEYIMAVAPGVPTWFWSVDGRHHVNDTENPDQEPFLEWLQDLQRRDAIPLVHSVSYSDIESTIDQAYRDQCDNLFQQLAIRGITVLFASGDDGAVGFQARDHPEKCQRSGPAYPNTSPYVTNVGATQLSRVVTPVNARNPKDTGVGTYLNFYAKTPSERVCSSDTAGVITSGGGFSDFAAMPEYQKDAVNAYLADPTVTLPPDTWFSRQNRAYPDVSAIGHKFLCLQSGQIVSVHGTSASTPVFAAIISLLNDKLLAAGQKPLGFLNPLLYKWAKEHPEAFIDVTAGDNRCPVVVKNCCQYGFVAARGWDPVTGLGSPRYDVMLDLLLPSTTGLDASASSSTEKTTKSIAAAGLAFGLIAFILSIVMLVLALRRNNTAGYSSIS